MLWGKGRCHYEISCFCYQFSIPTEKKFRKNGDQVKNHFDPFAL